MNDDKIKMLEEYIKLKTIPILISADKNIFKDYIEIKADCSNEVLKGKFDSDGYQSPPWYNEVKSKDNTVNLLIITNFDKADKTKQKRFVELLKYRKIGTLNLPENCVIILLASTINKESIDREIYSLVANIN